MPSPEKDKRFLQSVDGGLSRTEVRIIQSGVDEAEGGIPKTVSFLARVLTELRTPVRIENRPTAGEAVPGSPIALEIDAQPGLRGAGVSVTRIRSYDPFVKSRVCGMDLAIVRPGSHRAEAGVMDTQRLELLNAGLDVDEETVDAACRYAARFGRDCVQIPVSSTAAGTAALGGLIERMSARYPELELETTRAVESLHRLLSGYTEPDVIVASSTTAELLIEAALSVSGAESLATETRLAGDAVSTMPHLPPRCGEKPLPLCERPSTSILAAADLLVWAGRPGDAVRLVNAWNRTLEHGSHTAEFSVLSPASYRLSASELSAAIIDRLDDEPQVLDTDFMGAPGPGRGLAARPTLRLVS